MVQKYIQSIGNRGAVIMWAVANAAAKALMRKYPGMIGDIDIDSSSWAQSLFRRMGYVKRKQLQAKLTYLKLQGRRSNTYFYMKSSTELRSTISQNL